MTTYLIVLALIVLLSPIWWMLLFAWVFFLLGLLEWASGKLFPPAPPHCDIDPRCHQAFAWAKDGSGWIGSVRVIATTRDLLPVQERGA